MRPGLWCALGTLLAGVAMPPMVLAQGRGDTVVRVVGPGGRGLARVPLTVETVAGERDRVVVTDSEGQTVVARVPWDGSLRVRVAPLLFSGLLPEYRELWERHTAVIEGPQVELRSAIGMPARLEPVDAHTGQRVRGATWRSSPAVLHEDLEIVAEDGPHTVFVRPGDSGSLPFGVRRTPDGYVAWDPGGCTFLASRYATSFVARYPLRREARVSVELSGGAGKARIAYGFRTVQKLGPVRIIERDGDGRARLRGVPFLPDASFTFMLTERILPMWETGRIRLTPKRDVGRERIGDTPYALRAIPGAVVVSARLPTDRRSELLLRVRFPPPEAKAVAWPVYSGGGSGAGRRGGGPSVRSWREPGAGPELSVKVLRRNGEPAAGARVVMEYATHIAKQGARIGSAYVHADRAGVARFRGVSGRRARFQLAEPGLVRTWSDRIEVRDGNSTVLREGAGGSLVVRVKDQQGHALPFARVRAETRGFHHVRGAIHSWVAEGVQRVDRFTDQAGTRTYAHVSPGEVEVAAWWLDRVGGARVTVTENGTTEAFVIVEPRQR